LATEVAATGHAQATGECVLSFHVRLERNALCPVRTSDPNTVRSEEFIPGSAVHGLLARRHLNAGALDQAFYDRFFSERVRFLSA
jgi:hypothetical protein